MNHMPRITCTALDPEIDEFVLRIAVARRLTKPAPVPGEDLARALVERLEAMCAKEGPLVGFLDGNREAPACTLPRGHDGRCMPVLWWPWREAYCAANQVLHPDLDEVRIRLDLTEDEAREALRIYASAKGP